MKPIIVLLSLISFSLVSSHSLSLHAQEFGSPGNGQQDLSIHLQGYGSGQQGKKPSDFYRINVPNGQETKTVYVPKTPQEERLKFAPSKLKNLALHVGKGLVSFPIEMYQFYKVMGAFAVWDCTAKYKRNPNACMEFLTHMTDPMGVVSFAAFMGTSHAIQGVGSLAGKIGILAKSPVAANLIWSNLGLAAGSIVSSFIEEVGSDADIELVASFMWRRYAQGGVVTALDEQRIAAAQARIEKKWLSMNTIDKYGASTTSLITSALLSAQGTRLLFQGAKTNSLLAKVLLDQASSPQAKALYGTLVKQGENSVSVLMFRPWVVKLPIVRSLSFLSKARFATGPGGLVIFFLTEKIVSPIMTSLYNHTVYSSRYQESRHTLLTKFESQNVEHYGEIRREWRNYLKQDYTEGRASWDSRTTRFLSDLQSAFAFYQSFLRSPESISISTANYHSYYALKAMNDNLVDWETVSKFSPAELYSIIEAHKVGLSKDFYLRVLYNPSYSLNGIVSVLNKQNEMDRALNVEALNAGVEIDDVIKLNREQLQNVVEDRKSTKNLLSPIDYEVDTVVDPNSAFDLGGLGPVLIGGMAYRNMAEKLLVSMACGPQPGSSDMVTLPMLGFGVPAFHPPKIVYAKTPGKNPCHAVDANIGMPVNYKGQSISLVEYIAKNLDPKAYQTFFDKDQPWFEETILKTLDPVIEGFQNEIRDFSKRYLGSVLGYGNPSITLKNVNLPVLLNNPTIVSRNNISGVSTQPPVLSTLLNNPRFDIFKPPPQLNKSLPGSSFENRLPSIALPSKLFDSIENTRHELSLILLLKTPVLLQNKLKEKLIAFEGLMKTMPSSFNKFGWQGYVDYFFTEGGKALYKEYTPAQAHHFIGQSLIDDIETLLTQSMLQYPELKNPDGEGVNTFIQAILGELSKLNSELITIDATLNI